MAAHLSGKMNHLNCDDLNKFQKLLFCVIENLTSNTRLIALGLP